MTNPKINVDFSYDWLPAKGRGEKGKQSMPRPFPGRFPVNEVKLDDAVLTLQGTHWARTVELEARLTGRELLAGKAVLQGEGIHMDAQADVVWPELSGRATATATVGELAEWVKFGRDRGWFSLPKGFDLMVELFEIEAEAGFAEQRLQDWHVELFGKEVTASMESFEVSVGQVELKATGDGAEVSLEALVGVIGGRVTWSDGGGRLTGLEGDFELASLQPLASKGPQTLQFASIEQGEFATGSGQLRLSYASDRDGEPSLNLEITTTALGGNVRMVVDGRVRDPLALSIEVFLDAVQLEEIAPLFPQFEGRIEGVASGKLALRLQGAELFLLPGEIQLVAGTSGRFEYLRQGWLTQDPTLDPAAFLGERDILEIMKDSQGAQALTELAMRDLKMSEFSLKILEAASGNQSVVAKIKGNRSIKGVIVPVVLDVPISGDIEETINAVFEFNARM